MKLNKYDRWIEDIDLLSMELPKRHKNMFFNMKKEDFYNKIEYLKSILGELNDYEIKLEIAKIVSSIRDAHTSVNLPINLVCPLEFYWFKDGIYVTKTLSCYGEILFSRMISINKVGIDRVVEVLSTIISYENEAFLKSQLPKYLPAIELLFDLEIVDNVDYLELTCEDIDGHTKNIRIEALPIREGTERLKAIDIETRAVAKENIKELPLYMRNKDKAYWFEYIKESKAVYFKYNACRDMMGKNLITFSKELINFINYNAVEKLVIDLRNNFGGDSTLLDPFIDEISKCNKINGNGGLFIILGRETFSSAMLNAYSLSEKTKAILIGEPTGGKPNCYGEVERFSLKNSGLIICYSTKYYKIIQDDKLQSLIPDIEIDLTIQDYINNEDPCLEYIIKFNKS